MIYRSVLLRIRNVSGKSCTENQNTFMCNNFFFFFFDNRAVYEIVGENIVQAGRPQYKYAACELHVGCLKLQTHALRICNIRCFSTATMVAAPRLIVKIHVQYLYCYFFRHSFLSLSTHLHVGWSENTFTIFIVRAIKF